MAENIKIFAIAENFRLEESGRLKNFLLANADRPVQISLADLRRLDAMLLELLLVAAREWRENGLNFDVTDVSPSIETALQRLGVQSGLLGRRLAA